MKDGIKIADEMKFSAGKGFMDGLLLRGRMDAVLYDEHGREKDRRTKINTVTVLGHKMAADQLLASPSLAKPGWMEVGTGSGQTAASSILAAYISGSRTALDSKTRGSNAVVTMVCTFGAGTGTGAITEAGVFNIVTQNTTDLILYADFAVVNKGALDSLIVTWTLTFA